MSAFVVDRVHLDVLLEAGLRLPQVRVVRWFGIDPSDPEWSYEEHVRELTLLTADDVGRMLAEENVASVCFCYPQDSADDYEHELDYRYERPRRQATPVETLKAIACLEYQSCEHDGWHDSEARRFCEALRRAVIECLPGYDEAPWDWSGLETARRS